VSDGPGPAPFFAGRPGVRRVGGVPRVVDHAYLSAPARGTGRTLASLRVLAEHNDPFACGTPAHRTASRWFGALSARLGLAGRRPHLRRIHYRLLDELGLAQYFGAPYANTGRVWGNLTSVVKWARYLGVIDPTDLDDHRTPGPRLAEAPREPPGVEGDAGEVVDDEADLCEDDEAAWGTARVDAGVVWALPAVSTGLGAGLAGRLVLPGVAVAGYDYAPGDQPYRLEVLVEKSTLDDVLVPLCQELGVTLVTGIGFQSITATVAVLERGADAWAAGKPTRLFYLSDYDRAGDSMPVAVARQLEFWVSRYAPGADLKLTPVALTREQVEAYGLPGAPNTGAVELDALEGRRPGSWPAWCARPWPPTRTQRCRRASPGPRPRPTAGLPAPGRP
jgi:hypothetical protein